MVWKHSGDSVMYSGGTLMCGPKALFELRGYVYDANNAWNPSKRPR